MLVYTSIDIMVKPAWPEGLKSEGHAGIASTAGDNNLIARIHGAVNIWLKRSYGGRSMCVRYDDEVSARQRLLRTGRENQDSFRVSRAVIRHD